MADPLRILFVTSECAPWIKTGGLADVSAALPPALEACGADVRVLLPSYGALQPHLAHSRIRAPLAAHGPLPAANLVEAPLPSGVPAWLVDAPSLYARAGNPYLDAAGEGWPDNARRFAALARVAADLAGNAIDVDWRPDVIHCHDWQAGLAPGLCALRWRAGRHRDDGAQPRVPGPVPGRDAGGDRACRRKAGRSKASSISDRSRFSRRASCTPTRSRR